VSDVVRGFPTHLPNTSNGIMTTYTVESRNMMEGVYSKDDDEMIVHEHLGITAKFRLYGRSSSLWTP